ncbi:IS66-like element accessory protein TnpA [Aestuariicoccus sp. MJ-SS9]|uniref:IS66-like element accessory protein TnpA n=1 Tax=Aestuariicoccus sp. MJ-SS9 TaxID=3079855 RepID=UPI002909C1BE|nr:transposase [Aestuariicoccus sp. MJ-SS9]MDU8914204.1 transposase [Aestuariicoccus sp. MJ-SS9]
MAGRRKKRFWSDDEKRSICLQTAVPGVSVAQVARRYAMNANLIFKWLKDPRFAPAVIEAEADPAFLPVEISPIVSPSEPVQPSGLGTPGGRIEIELAGGHRISAEGGFDPDMLARLLT